MVAGLAVAQPVPGLRNVIYIIGDGTSFPQLEAGRVAKGGPLYMDGMPVQHQVGNASLDDAVTDSAAGATAHATGQRTNNGMIAMLPNGTAIRTILEMAKAAGMATGVVTNDAIHGATPGSYVAHVPDRNMTDAITEQAVFVTQPDVLLGGGLTVFRNIGGPNRLGQTDYQFVQTRGQLLAWDPTSEKKLLGLFAATTMGYAVDQPRTEPTIAEMAKVALDTLAAKGKPFFLMIEDGLIDKAGHANNLRNLVHQVLAFDEMIKVVLDFASQRNDTLVVISADHETGGLTQGQGRPKAEVLLQGPQALSSRIITDVQNNPRVNVGVLLLQYAGIDYVEPHAYQGNFSGFVESLVSRSAYQFTTTGHTDLPVPVVAQGPGAERLREAQHIADVGRIVMEMLGLNREGAR